MNLLCFGLVFCWVSGYDINSIRYKSSSCLLWFISFYSSVGIVNNMLCSVCALILFNFFFSFLFVMVQLERGLHGLEPVVVANFPTKKYSDEYFSASEDAQYVVSFIVEFFNVLDFICPSSILFYIGKNSFIYMIVCLQFAGFVILFLLFIH